LPQQDTARLKTKVSRVFGGLGMSRGNLYSHKFKGGFSSLEMMVAIGILATVFILAMPFFSQQGKIIKQLRTSANCQAILDTAFSRVNSFGNSLDAYQPLMNPALVNSTGTAAANARMLMLPAAVDNNYDPDFKAQRQNIYNLAPGGALYVKNGSKNILLPPDSAPVSQTIAHDGVTLYTPLLLKGSMEYLATKYNAGYCSALTPVKLLTATDSNALSALFQGGLRNLDLRMRVNRYNLSTNATSSAACGTFWPRPRNAARSNIVYEPQFGNGVAFPRQTIGQFPNWIQDQDGFRVTMRASYTNDKGQTEDCEGTKDFSLPEDKQNVVDYFYDVNFIKVSTTDPTKLDANFINMRAGTKCNGGSCLGHPFETIYTNLQPYSASNPSWPDDRERPLCTQLPTNNTDMVVTLRVYNPQKEPGLVPMCIDTSYQWFKNTPNNWCNGAYNAGVETSFDKSWNPRYTGWVPCENMMFCNSRPDRVEVVKSAASNSKLAGMSVPSQPYIEYKYHYDRISGDKNNPRMWGCELRFGVSMLDMAGNLSYVPLTEGPGTDSYIAGDKRPAIKEINPRVYFKPPPCYTCNCKPCKSKGLFGGLFNWLLFFVAIITGGALLGLLGSIILGAMCLNGGLGCRDDGGGWSQSTSGGKYRSCNDSNNGCKCGQQCSKIKPPAPGWTTSYSDNQDISKIEQNSCTPGSTFYVNGTAMNMVGTMKPILAYKVPKGAGGAGYTYLTDPTANKIQPGDEVMWSGFDAAAGKFCYVAARCGQGKLNVIKESSSVVGDTNMYPLMGCSDVKVGKKINFDSSTYGISQGGDACLEVNFMTGPQNPEAKSLWKWSDHNEQCIVTSASGGHSSDPRFVAGKCPQGATGTTTGSTGSADYTPAGPGCAPFTKDPNDIESINFACKSTKKVWDDCDGTLVPSCPKWCYPECTVPSFVPEHPWMENPLYKSQRFYETMTAADKDLPFCTMDKKQFDVGF